MTKAFLAILPIVIVTACVSDLKEYQEYRTQYINDRQFSSTIESYTVPTLIELDSTCQFYNSGSTFSLDSSIYLSFINRKSFDLEIYNLTEKKPIKNIKLTSIDPIGWNNLPERVAYLNSDSIFILTPHELYLISDEGTLLKKYKLPFGTFAVMGNEFDLSFSERRVGIQYINSLKGRNSDEFYNQPLEVFVDIKSGAISYSSQTSTLLYKEGYYGLSDLAQRTDLGAKTIYTFAYDPNIYLEAKKDLKTEVYGGKSRYQNPILSMTPQEQNNLILHRIYSSSTPTYYRITYDPYKKLYYRLFINAKTEYNEYGGQIELFEHEKYLMVFDKNLNLLDELELGEINIFPYNPIVTPNGILFREWKMSKGKINFKLIRIDEKYI